jgi:hypothetical protein
MGNMLLDDIEHGKNRWDYRKVWELRGYNGNYPRSGTLAHFKWGQERGQVKDSINNYFEAKKRPERIAIVYGNGDKNEWRAVPKDEVLHWETLSTATKIIGAMILQARRLLGLSNAKGLPPGAAMKLRALSAGIESMSNPVLETCQTINGKDKAEMQELQEWYNRKVRKFRRLLDEGEQPEQQAKAG